ncbi:SGNH/GDSL hydrolase family protein [Rathayibacter sp. SD072]|uniref:SGNH/GDSL hydrolase family protein n=1 Tax=Rathayibacter sp. SD072 TaxID=2781731 RepID=UPI001A956B14|nr:SGNH/GDSL hydrolase family protein [Rathayibacter sp. SD072]MBO0982245.1 SGNH/GDSL hydrolase family protein [Rathayibacter sp. SD072]
MIATRRLAAIGVLVLALAGCSSAAEPASESSATTAPSTTSAPSSDAGAHAVEDPAPLEVGGSIPAGSRVTVVGDSIVRGYGLDAGAAWPALVGDAFGWTVTNLGCDGGGFVRPGVCGEPIGDRADDIAATSPDVVIVVASSNDLGTPVEDVVAAIPSAVDAIARGVPSARLIALDSVWGPDPRPGDLDAYDAALVDAVASAGGSALEYPDPLRTDGLLAEDGVHPTEAGQLALAEAFALAAQKAGLGESVPTDSTPTREE